MKAAVYCQNGGPEVLKYEDVPDPECHPKGVVIRVEAVSIEGGDTLNRWDGVLFSKPHVVGYQAGGRNRPGRFGGDGPEGRSEGHPS